MVNTYKDFTVWQKSIQLVEEVYLITKQFPKDELFGITNQMRRAVVSIPSNIAEGFARKSIKERNQFYSIAFGSAMELETQLIISKRLDFIPEDKFKKAESIIDEVLRMLNRLCLNTKSSSC
ncbi:MAG TPA: four helix bundle protein [Patescibacteria group bacterium]|nr:four helix bundle protein [Patescibacteria group bacterium]